MLQLFSKSQFCHARISSNKLDAHLPTKMEHSEPSEKIKEQNEIAILPLHKLKLFTRQDIQQEYLWT